MPQGSILGPLLFLIYINDLPLASDFTCLLYADDTTLLLSDKNISELYSKANKSLKDVEKWFTSNTLNLHPQKTKYILHSNSNKQPGLELNLLNNNIDRIGSQQSEQSFKLVGVHIDDTQNWKAHINHIRSKISVSLVYINRSKKFLTYNIKSLLYKALIESHLQYCITIWGGAPINSLKPLEIIQKKAIRIITGKKYNSHCDPLFARTKNLKIKDLYELSCLKFAQSIINKYAIKPMAEIFPIEIYKKYQIRSQITQKLAVPQIRTEEQKSMPSFMIPKLWNSEERPYDAYTLISAFKGSCFRNYDDFLCYKPDCFSCCHVPC